MQLRNIHILPLLALLMLISVALGSCVDDKNEYIISQGKMEDVLYEYHLVDGIVRTGNVDSTTARKYLESIYRKYDITQAQFDSSMVYYIRHADLLDEIYANLVERMNNEANLQGVESVSSYAVSTDPNADTTNIWNLDPTRVFTTKVPYNMLKFEFKTDSTYKPGDRFMLSFNSEFIVQDGARNGLAVMALKLDNDSVITKTVSITSAGSRRLEVCDTIDRRGIKMLKGFFILRDGFYGADRKSSSPRIMVLKDIALIKMHTKKSITKNDNKDEKTDSTNSAPADTLHLPKPGVHQLHSR